ncbi:MAG TPA: site-2 protease family protein [Bacillota bacterium]|nr:site-2 protease family protein [Bacillota bacterium]
MLRDFDLTKMAYMLPAILFGLTIHEFFHALTAYQMGDDTAQKQGRLTMNPIPHIDLFGFIIMLLVGFGWAKPVPIDPRNFKRPKRDEILVSLAGPASNLVLAVLFGAIFKAMLTFAPQLFQNNQTGDLLSNFFVYGIWINLVLAVFNLFPIPPLDGSHILMVLIPDRYYEFKRKLLQFGSVGLMLLIILGNQFDLDILPIFPMVQFLFKGLVRMLALN